MIQYKVNAVNMLIQFLAASAVVALAGNAGAQPARPRPGGWRMPDRLRVGVPAPDFKLKTKEGDREVQLLSFKRKRPVVLVFGSYT